MGLFVENFVFNDVHENTYIVYDLTSKEAIMVDAGMQYPHEEQAIKDFIANNGLKLKFLVSTHLHFDHVFGNNFVMREFGVPVYYNKDDEFWLDNFVARVARFGILLKNIEPPMHSNNHIVDGDSLKLGEYEFKVLATPGHSPGSVSLYNPESKMVFTGDALFKGSIGRTDLQGGDIDLLISSVKSKLLNLPEDTVVFSGHGPSTTVGDEKKYNRFFN